MQRQAAHPVEHGLEAGAALGVQRPCDVARCALQILQALTAAALLCLLRKVTSQAMMRFLDSVEESILLCLRTHCAQSHLAVRLLPWPCRKAILPDTCVLCCLLVLRFQTHATIHSADLNPGLPGECYLYIHTMIDMPCRKCPEPPLKKPCMENNEGHKQVSKRHRGRRRRLADHPRSP